CTGYDPVPSLVGTRHDPAVPDASASSAVGTSILTTARPRLTSPARTTMTRQPGLVRSPSTGPDSRRMLSTVAEAGSGIARLTMLKRGFHEGTPRPTSTQP